MTILSFRYICTVALLVGTFAAYAWSGRRKPDALAQPLETIDKQLAGWTISDTEKLTDRMLDRLQLTSYIARTYQKGDTRLDLFVSYYAEQRTGETMHSPKHCLPGAGWEIWKNGSAMVPVNGRQVEINQYSIQKSGQRNLVFYWYQSKDRILASEYMGKILLAKDTLLSSHTGGSLVRIILPDLPTSPAQGIAFATAVIPQVQRCLGTAN